MQIPSQTLQLFLVLTLVPVASTAAQQTGTRPNIVVILADDMGYSDIGCFGGEIETPNLDQLAANGVCFTHFYNCGKCCPTRASLLTGLYPHQAGIGWMVSTDLGHPGYRGDLSPASVTIAEVLSDAGYHCYAAGKWHVTPWNYKKGNGPKHNRPLKRGFHQFFGKIDGSGNYFLNRAFRDDRQVAMPKDSYFTDAISDETVKFIRQRKTNRHEQPFFAYVAYTAPHFPLHAKDEDIRKYLGRYSEGWQVIRDRRHARQLELGIIDASWTLPQADSPPWSEVPLEQRELWDKRMAVYAAQVDCMDQGIGRIVQALEATDQLDNTLLFFLSDNGGSAQLKSRAATSLQALGTPSSYESYRREWANVSNTPFRLYKRYAHEGGIATPLILHWPSGIEAKSSLVATPGHVIDVMATCIDVAAATYPSDRNGTATIPLEGKSLLVGLDADSAEPRNLYWEYEANRAVRSGHWKAVTRGLNEPWELYDMRTDRTETHNLASIHRKLTVQLEDQWNSWAARCNVLPLNGTNRQQRQASNQISGTPPKNVN